MDWALTMLIIFTSVCVFTLLYSAIRTGRKLFKLRKIFYENFYFENYENWMEEKVKWAKEVLDQSEKFLGKPYRRVLKNFVYNDFVNDMEQRLSLQEKLLSGFLWFKCILFWISSTFTFGVGAFIIVESQIRNLKFYDDMIRSRIDTFKCIEGRYRVDE